ncbi:MAG: nucleotidyltransferase family protein [Chloroflexi bacterium]|nr:nucleotidyltransferase family protein [Chloroflexota bacterium]
MQEPSDATRQTVSAALVATTDWSTLVRVAMEHRVVGYVARAAAECDVELPHGVQQTLRHLTLVKTGEGLRMELHLRRVASAFQDAAIPMIVLKGPALSRTLYPEIGLRPYADLDLTIRDQDEQSAVDVLEAEGFHEIVDPFENARRPHRSEEGHEGHFHRRFENADGVLVELHLDPLQLGLKTVCEDGRWSRAESLPGVPGALMLGPEDQVVQLSVHAHKHGFERLIWLKDLDLLLRRHAGSLNWGLIQDVARAEGVAGSVWYALWLTRKLLNTPLRDRELRALQPAMPVRVAYHWVWPVRSVARLQARMHRRAVQFRAADSLRGMLPATLLMGRRWARTRALVDVALG